MLDKLFRVHSEKNGAAMNGGAARDYDRRTPLHVASSEGRAD